jgi:hypothetical protein
MVRQKTWADETHLKPPFVPTENQFLVDPIQHNYTKIFEAQSQPNNHPRSRHPLPIAIEKQEKALRLCLAYQKEEKMELLKVLSQMPPSNPWKYLSTNLTKRSGQTSYILSSTMTTYPIVSFDSDGASAKHTAYYGKIIRTGLRKPLTPRTTIHPIG